MAISSSFMRRVSRERLAASLFFRRLSQYESSFRSSGTFIFDFFGIGSPSHRLSALLFLCSKYDVSGVNGYDGISKLGFAIGNMFGDILGGKVPIPAIRCELYNCIALSIGYDLNGRGGAAINEASEDANGTPVNNSLGLKERSLSAPSEDIDDGRIESEQTLPDGLLGLLFMLISTVGLDKSRAASAIAFRDVTEN